MDRDDPEETHQEEPMHEATDPNPNTSGADDLAAVREVVLRAYPETIPELIGGASVEELLGSVEAAAAAYQRMAEEMAARTPAAAPAAPLVPAGSAPAVAIDPERLPSVEKIRRGLATRR